MPALEGSYGNLELRRLESAQLFTDWYFDDIPIPMLPNDDVVSSTIRMY